MGYTTDFLGHVDVNPPMNEAEQAYLSAFGDSRRFDRPGGPYEVPGNPAAENAEGCNVPAEVSNRLAEGQPGSWCDWAPCLDGCCIAYNGREKFYQAVGWLKYLTNHFLRPGAYAQESGLSCFDDFTFDHRLDGLVVGCRRDNKEMFAIRVEDSVVTRETLWPADARYLDYPPLPYEQEIDRWARRSRPPVGRT
ncbi:MAG: hypothetical protein L0K86_01810 [Actinomycetia bacterium]|nr:hypothetical protein [Actinomycetes bacterium]